MKKKMAVKNLLVTHFSWKRQWKGEKKPIRFDAFEFIHKTRLEVLPFPSDSTLFAR